MSDDGDFPNSRKTPIVSSRTIKYVQRFASIPASSYTAETTVAHHLSPTNRISSSSASSQTTETSDLLLTPWPGNYKKSPVTTVSSWDFPLTPTASSAAMSASSWHTYPSPHPSDHVLLPPNSPPTYSTGVSIQAPPPHQTMSPRLRISGATLSSDNSTSFLGSAKDQINTSHHYEYQATTQTFPSLPTPSLPPQWLIIGPPTTYNVLVLPPPGYVLWVPISQPPGLTFFKPSDTKPKDGVIEASPTPSDWQNRTAIQREHWVEMTIFQKIPIIRKSHSRWRCGLKKCKRWTTKGNLWPIVATEYLVHQLEAHEGWWSRSDEGRIHLNRLKCSLPA